MTKIILFFLFISAISGCVTKIPHIQRCGSFLYKNLRYDSLEKKMKPAFNLKDIKYWYKDSLIISENHGIKYAGIDNKLISYEVYIHHYTFMDLRANIFAIYKNFSDTALPILTFNLDTKDRPTSIWELSKDTIVMSFDSTLILADTVMNNTRYKRIRNFGKTKDGNIPYTSTLYASYNRNNFLVCLNRSTSKKIGFPIIRSDYTAPNSNIYAFTEFDFLADTLNENEEKVFDAWEKNIKKYPVQDKNPLGL